MIEVPHAGATGVGYSWVYQEVFQHGTENYRASSLDFPVKIKSGFLVRALASSHP
jgi:hypothetical protein